MRSLQTWSLPRWASKLGTCHLEGSPWLETFLCRTRRRPATWKRQNYSELACSKGVGHRHCAWQRHRSRQRSRELPRGEEGAQGAWWGLGASGDLATRKAGNPGDWSGAGWAFWGLSWKQDDYGRRPLLIGSWPIVTGVTVRLLGCCWRQEPDLARAWLTAGRLPGRGRGLRVSALPSYGLAVVRLYIIVILL